MSDTGKGAGVDRKRRELLRGGAAAGAGALAGAVVPGAAAAEAPPEPAEREPAKKGYRLTGHILAYYKSAES